MHIWQSTRRNRAGSYASPVFFFLPARRWMACPLPWDNVFVGETRCNVGGNVGARGKSLPNTQHGGSQNWIKYRPHIAPLPH